MILQQNEMKGEVLFMHHLKKLSNKCKVFFKEKVGASNVEIIIWVSVVLVIATALFFFRDEIISFLGRATGKVSELRVN